jgi:general secretion pathway protein D
MHSSPRVAPPAVVSVNSQQGLLKRAMTAVVVCLFSATVVGPVAAQPPVMGPPYIPRNPNTPPVSTPNAPNLPGNVTPRGTLLSAPLAESLRNGPIRMNYENIDIKVLARLISEITGRNIVLDDRVQGKVTILCSTEMSSNEAYQVFKAAMERYGFQLRERGGFVLVAPTADVRKEGALRVNPRGHGNDSEANVVGLIITKTGDATQLMTALRPIVSDPNNIQPYANGKAVIIIDKAKIVAKASEIARRLDKTIPSTKAIVVIPKYAEAEKLAAVLTQMTTRPNALPGDPQPAKVSAFAPTNGILMQGTDAQLRELQTIVKRLDIPKAAPDEIEKPQLYVHFLQYASPEETAKILSNMLGERKNQQTAQQQLDANQLSAAAKPAVDPNAFPKLNAEAENQRVSFVSAKVASDIDTNSVILFVSPSEYKEVQDLLSELDVPRKQVLVLAMVAEVSLTKLIETGARLQVATPGGVLSTYKAGLTEEGLLSALSGGNFAVGTVGGNSQTINVGGRDVKVPTFFAFLSGNKSNSDFNLLSSPRLLTADHKEAKMEVGDVVPFPTGARFDNFGQPLLTYDYKDVGIKLKFTPHISQSDTIRIDLDQQVQEVTEYLRQNLGGTGYSVPLISNRSIKTNVTVKEGETLLIGGLISKRTVETISKVPILGDIPIIDNFFKETRKEDRKTTLFVALTPYIVQHPDEIARLDRPHQEFIKTQNLPNQSQNEPRETAGSRHAVPDPYSDSTSKAAGNGPDLATLLRGQLKLDEFKIQQPKGPDNLRQARVRVRNNSDKEIQMGLQTEVIQPNGQSKLLPITTINLRAGEIREVELAPYQFPDQMGMFEFDVRALIEDQVVARLPSHNKLEVQSLAPAAGGSRETR